MVPEVPVTRSGLYLEDTVLDLNLGRAECASTHLVDEAGLGVFILRAKASGDGGRSRASNDPKGVETMDWFSIIGALMLRVVETARQRNHCIAYRLSKVGLRRVLHIRKHHRGNPPQG